MPNPLNLAIIGDPHVAVPQGANDTRIETDPGRKLQGYSVELLEATVAAINAEPNVDAVLVLGDLTRDGEEFNHVAARRILDQLSRPHYLMLGNHDLERKRKPGISYPDTLHFSRADYVDFYYGHGLPGRVTHYVVDLPGNVVLIVLDSNRALEELAQGGDDEFSGQDDGWIGAAQFKWLEGVLDKVRAGGQLPLVAVHHACTNHTPAEEDDHPLSSIFRSWQIKDASALRALLARYRVPLVLSGHLHAQSVNTQDGIVNLVTSASVAYPHAWRLLRIGDGEIQVSSHRVASIPSVPNLQEMSRKWLAGGMGTFVAERASSFKLLNGLTRAVGELMRDCGWWESYCDGTQAGFTVADEHIPDVGPLKKVVMKQVVKQLDAFGEWKAARPDPNELTISYLGDA